MEGSRCDRSQYYQHCVVFSTALMWNLHTLMLWLFGAMWDSERWLGIRSVRYLEALYTYSNSETPNFGPFLQLFRHQFSLGLALWRSLGLGSNRPDPAHIRLCRPLGYQLRLFNRSFPYKSLGRLGSRRATSVFNSQIHKCETQTDDRPNRSRADNKNSEQWQGCVSVNTCSGSTARTHSFGTPRHKP